MSVGAAPPSGLNSKDFPLLVHVLGAMLLVGALVLAASALILALTRRERLAGSASPTAPC